ncbi:SDR family NAD(P)-dependent oxidoreductase [Nocardia aurea]|uniref:SDR family NAD(P)-dependent oxidoreductase n=1 Tax=Nocardia aurea TaxID=2144174 RepID=UPI001E44B0CD|nr:SDR family oxidoreductase [Nocardia aurea]
MIARTTASAAKTILVVGAGPGLGYSVAERFGREGFKVALVSRNEANLDDLVIRLGRRGIEAAGFTADVVDQESLTDAIAAAEARFGAVDVLEYSPAPEIHSVVDALAVTPTNAQLHIARALVGAITAVRAVLPGMIERADGTLFFTIGASAILPLPAHASVGLGMSALRNYAHVLHAALRGTGVYAGSLMVATRIAKDTPGDPDLLAAEFWTMYRARDRFEMVVGDLRSLAVAVQERNVDRH